MQWYELSALHFRAFLIGCAPPRGFFFVALETHMIYLHTCEDHVSDFEDTEAFTFIDIKPGSGIDPVKGSGPGFYGSTRNFFKKIMYIY